MGMSVDITTDMNLTNNLNNINVINDVQNKVEEKKNDEKVQANDSTIVTAAANDEDNNNNNNNDDDIEQGEIVDEFEYIISSDDEADMRQRIIALEEENKEIEKLTNIENNYHYNNLLDHTSYYFDDSHTHHTKYTDFRNFYQNGRNTSDETSMSSSDHHIYKKRRRKADKGKSRTKTKRYNNNNLSQTTTTTTAATSSLSSITTYANNIANNDDNLLSSSYQHHHQLTKSLNERISAAAAAATTTRHEYARKNVMKKKLRQERNNYQCTENVILIDSDSYDEQNSHKRKRRSKSKDIPKDINYSQKLRIALKHNNNSKEAAAIPLKERLLPEQQQQQQQQQQHQQQNHQQQQLLEQQPPLKDIVPKDVETKENVDDDKIIIINNNNDDTNDSMEEQELRCIALKSAIINKHLARKKRNAEKAYSPTDFEQIPYNMDLVDGNSDIEVMDTMPTCMDISPIASPILRLGSSDIEECSKSNSSSIINNNTNNFKPIDMDIANSESDTEQQIHTNWLSQHRQQHQQQQLTLPTQHAENYITHDDNNYAYIMPQHYAIYMPQMQYEPSSMQTINCDPDDIDVDGDDDDDDDDDEIPPPPPRFHLTPQTTNNDASYETIDKLNIQPDNDDEEAEALRAVLLSKMRAKKQNQTNAKNSSQLTIKTVKQLNNLVDNQQDDASILKEAVKRIQMKNVFIDSKSADEAYQSAVHDMRISPAQQLIGMIQEELYCFNNDVINKMEMINHVLGDETHQHMLNEFGTKKLMINNEKNDDNIIIENTKQTYMNSIENIKNDDNAAIESIENIQNETMKSQTIVKQTKQELHNKKTNNLMPIVKETTQADKQILANKTAIIKKVVIPNVNKNLVKSIQTKLNSGGVVVDDASTIVTKIVKTKTKVINKKIELKSKLKTNLNENIKPTRLIHELPKRQLKQFIIKLQNSENDTSDDECEGYRRCFKQNTNWFKTHLNSKNFEQIDNFDICDNNYYNDNNNILNDTTNTLGGGGGGNNSSNCSTPSRALTPTLEQLSVDGNNVRSIVGRTIVNDMFEKKLDKFLKNARSTTALIEQQKIKSPIKFLPSTPDRLLDGIQAKAVDTNSAVRHLPSKSQREYRYLIDRMNMLEKQRKSEKGVEEKEPLKSTNTIKDATLTVPSKTEQQKTTIPTQSKVELLKSSLTEIESKKKLFNAYENSYKKISDSILTKLTDSISLVEEVKESKLQKLRCEERIKKLQQEINSENERLNLEKKRLSMMHLKIYNSNESVDILQKKRLNMITMITKLGNDINGDAYRFDNHYKTHIQEKSKLLAYKMKFVKNLKLTDSQQHLNKLKTTTVESSKINNVKTLPTLKSSKINDVKNIKILESSIANNTNVVTTVESSMPNNAKVVETVETSKTNNANNVATVESLELKNANTVDISKLNNANIVESPKSSNANTVDISKLNNANTVRTVENSQPNSGVNSAPNNANNLTILELNEIEVVSTLENSNKAITTPSNYETFENVVEEIKTIDTILKNNTTSDDTKDDNKMTDENVESMEIDDQLETKQMEEVAMDDNNAQQNNQVIIDNKQIIEDLHMIGNQENVATTTNKNIDIDNVAKKNEKVAKSTINIENVVDSIENVVNSIANIETDVENIAIQTANIANDTKNDVKIVENIFTNRNVAEKKCIAKRKYAAIDDTNDVISSTVKNQKNETINVAETNVVENVMLTVDEVKEKAVPTTNKMNENSSIINKNIDLLKNNEIIIISTEQQNEINEIKSKDEQYIDIVPTPDAISNVNSNIIKDTTTISINENNIKLLINKLQTSNSNHKKSIEKIEKVKATTKQMVENSTNVIHYECKMKELTISPDATTEPKKLKPYVSPLLYLENYISDLDPNGIMCPYELMGQCQDQNCKYTHLNKLLQQNQQKSN